MGLLIRPGALPPPFRRGNPSASLVLTGCSPHRDCEVCSPDVVWEPLHSQAVRLAQGHTAAKSLQLSPAPSFLGLFSYGLCMPGHLPPLTGELQTFRSEARLLPESTGRQFQPQGLSHAGSPPSSQMLPEGWQLSGCYLTKCLTSGLRGSSRACVISHPVGSSDTFPFTAQFSLSSRWPVATCWRTSHEALQAGSAAPSTPPAITEQQGSRRVPLSFLTQLVLCQRLGSRPPGCSVQFGPPGGTQATPGRDGAEEKEVALTHTVLWGSRGS